MTISFTKNSFRLFLWAFLLLLAVQVNGQENFVAYGQPGVGLEYKVSKNYFHNFSLQQRNYLYRDHFEATTRQIDLVHFSKLKIANSQSVALGVQYRFRSPFESEKDNELRLTQQYNITKKPSVVRYGHRVRTEQRITPAGTIHRFRYRFTLDFPLSGQKLDVGELYLAGSWEHLLSAAKASQPQYDQRFTGILGIKVSKKVKVQLGLEYRFEDYVEETHNVLLATTILSLSL